MQKNQLLAFRSQPRASRRASATLVRSEEVFFFAPGLSGRLALMPFGACAIESLTTLFCVLQVPGPVQAPAQLQRRARRRQEARRRLKPAPPRRGATSPSSSRSPTGRAGRGRGPEVCPHAPHRPLRARHDSCHPLHRSRTARRPHPQPDPLSPLGRSTPPRTCLFAQALATGRRSSSRLGSGAARRRSGGGLARLGCPGAPVPSGRLWRCHSARRAASEACARRCSAYEKRRVSCFKYVFASHHCL